MSNLTEREQIIRGRIRRIRAEHWEVVRERILIGAEAEWLEFWREHWPPDKQSCMYALGERYDSDLVWAIRLGLHFLRMSEERQMERECVFGRRG